MILVVWQALLSQIKRSPVSMAQPSPDEPVSSGLGMSQALLASQTDFFNSLLVGRFR
jgi:hypothetical protein